MLADSRFDLTIALLLLIYPNRMSYVVASAIKDLLKKAGMMTSGDLPEAASKFLEEALKGAAARAKDNGRVTVRPCDL
jgi:histone H3/H4